MTEADFSGYVTKAGLKCSDGRTITAEAFKHQDKLRVPLVWQHGHNDPSNVLGHVDLEARGDGVYGYGYFNSTKQGENSKLIVEHGDIVAMSIFANQLVEKNKVVLHGMIKEVSLCIGGANPGAKIDYVRIAHSDGEIETSDEVAIITTGLELEHAVKTYQSKTTTTTTDLVDGVVTGTRSESHESTRTRDDANDRLTEVAYGDMEHADGDKSVKEVMDSFSEAQMKVVHAMIGAAIQSANEDDEDEDDKTVAQSDIAQSTDSTAGTDAGDISTTDTITEGDLTHQEGTTVVTRLFDQSDSATGAAAKTLSHADVTDLLGRAQKAGSFKEAFLGFAAEKELSHSELAHSITNLELMFPDAKNPDGNTPQWISRRMEWVSKVLDGTKHSPFSHIKTVLADITADEARAKGYVKGNQKTDEVLELLQRTTRPTTIYKKQSLDRDDLVDITDFNVVLWLKAEMRMMIEEELARAILVGDGRAAGSPDKVKDPRGAVDGIGIRSVVNDDALYSIKTELAANVNPKDAVKGLVRARSAYRGSGQPTLFISDEFLTDVMLEEDKFGRPLYETQQILKDLLRVRDIVPVDLFNGDPTLFAIMVSLSDYTIGTTAGGELTSFEDFDIDFNKHKYLQETRLSGALTKPFSAIVVRRAMGTLVTPTAPSFDGTTDTVTIPTITGVFYTLDDGTVVTGSRVITQPTTFHANPADGYYFASNTTRSWTYTP